MPRTGREQQERERRENAERWAAWLNPALKEAGWTPAALGAASDGAISRQVASKWTNADHAPVPKLAILTARLLHRDAVEALRAAGHAEIAQLAEEMRADPVAAQVKQELQAIEDDPYLGRLDAWADRGVITEQDRDRRRAEYLADKKRDIETVIPQAYAAEVERISAGRGEPNGSPGRTAL
jgi:hypothetical protein